MAAPRRMHRSTSTRFVEGNDIGRGTVDVVVTDGFTGNVALKSIEGTAKLYTQFVPRCFQDVDLRQIGFLCCWRSSGEDAASASIRAATMAVSFLSSTASA